MFVLLFCLYIAFVNAVVVIVNYLGLFRLAIFVFFLLIEGYCLLWVTQGLQTDICTTRMRTFLQLL